MMPGSPLGLIIEETARAAGLAWEDMVAERRDSRATRARQAAAWLARRLTGRSTTIIGRMLGGRDHTTIIHAVVATDARRAADPVFRDWLDMLEEHLRLRLADLRRPLQSEEQSAPAPAPAPVPAPDPAALRLLVAARRLADAAAIWESAFFGRGERAAREQFEAAKTAFAIAIHHFQETSACAPRPRLPAFPFRKAARKRPRPSSGSAISAAISPDCRPI